MSRCSKPMLAAALVLTVVGASSCDKPTSGGSSGPAIVGGYDRVAVGTVHTYQINGGANSYRMEIIAASPTAFTRRSQQVGDTLYLENVYEVVDGGVYLVTSSTHTTGVATLSYSPRAVMLAADVTPGYTETTVSLVTGVSAFSSTRALTVDGVETVTVPAGAYEALKVTTIVSQSNT